MIFPQTRCSCLNIHAQAARFSYSTHLKATNLTLGCHGARFPKSLVRRSQCLQKVRRRLLLGLACDILRALHGLQDFARFTSRHESCHWRQKLKDGSSLAKMLPSMSQALRGPIISSVCRLCLVSHPWESYDSSFLHHSPATWYLNRSSE